MYPSMNLRTMILILPVMLIGFVILIHILTAEALAKQLTQPTPIDFPIVDEFQDPVDMSLSWGVHGFDYYHAHVGVDYNLPGKADHLERVFPIAVGQVIEARRTECEPASTDWYKGCFITIRHLLSDGTAIESGYWHLVPVSQSGDIYPTVGTIVQPTRDIARVGNTGNSDGFHLHLQLEVPNNGIITKLEGNEFIADFNYYVANGTNVTIFDDPYFREYNRVSGAQAAISRSFFNGKVNLEGSSLNNEASMIAVPNGSSAMVLDDARYLNVDQVDHTFTRSDFDLSNNSFWSGGSMNNAISALVINGPTSCPAQSDVVSAAGIENCRTTNPTPIPGQPTPQSPGNFAPVVGGNLPPTTAKFFSERYFVEPIAAFPEGGPYNLGQPQLFSIDLPDGWSAKLFRANGSNRCFSGDIPNLMDHEEWWRETKQVMLFDHNACQPVQQASGPSDEVRLCTKNGACYDFRTGLYKDLTKMADSQHGGHLNDKFVRIAWMPSDMSIRLVRETGMVGESFCYTYARDLHDRDQRELKEQVSSFQVFSSPHCPPDQSAVPVLHQDNNHTGNEFALGLNYGRLKFTSFPHGSDWNDRARSISIPHNTSIWKAEHSGMKGRVDCHASGHQFTHVDDISDIFWAPNGSCIYIPENPTNLRTTDISKNSVTLAWNDVTIGKLNEAGYHLEQWNGTKFLSKAVLAPNATNYTYTDLTCGTEYTFKLNAFETLVDAKSSQLVVKARTSDCPPPPDCNTLTFSGVGLYKDHNCTNEGVELEEAGWYHLDKFNNSASSIYVAPGWSLEVFDNIGSSDGYYSCITESKWDLSVDPYFWTESTMDDSITSLRIYHDNKCGKSQPAYGNCDNVTFNGVMFFDYPHCQGSELGFAAPAANNLTTFDNLASSVYVPDGWSVRMYATPSGVGKSFCATNSLWDLSEWNYSTTTQWIENSVTYAEVFQDAHCGELSAPIPFSPADGLTVQSGDQVLLQWSNTGAHTYWGEIWGADGYFQSFGVNAHSYLLNNLTEGKYTWTIRGAVDEHLSELNETTFYVGSHCENQSNGVILFDRTACRGDREAFDESGYYSLGELNNRTSSIFVEDGWSVEVFENTSNADGSTICFQQSKWDLSYDNYWIEALTADGTISSLRVWDVPNCGRQLPIVGCDLISSTDVVLFDHTHCLGLDKSFSALGFYMLEDFDDLTSSIFIPSGKSVRLYMNKDKTGSYTCASDTKWHMEYDYYWGTNEGNLFNNISAIEIFDDDLCGGAPAPIVASPTNSSQISELDEIVIQWSNIYAGGYWVEMWGPNGYFKSSGHLTHNEWNVGSLLPGSYVFRVVGEVFGEVGPASEDIRFDVTDATPSPDMMVTYELDPDQVNKVTFRTKNCIGQWVHLVFGDGEETDSPCNSGQSITEHDYPYDGSAVAFNASVGGIDLMVDIPTASTNKSCGERFPNSGVTLFTESECQGGTSRTFTTIGIYALTDINDQVSAIIPADGWSIEVFENSGSHDGHAYCVTRDIWDLSYESYYATQGFTLDNNISAIKVYSDSTCGKQLPQYGGCDDNIQYEGVVLFDYIHCGGSELSINQAGKYELGFGGSFNNLASSAHVATGWSVKVYEHSDWTGNNVCLTTDIWDLGTDVYSSTDIVVNNTISSIEVIHSHNCQKVDEAPLCDAITGPGVKLFDSHYCLGESEHYTATGLINLTNINDQVSSLYVQPGWSVYLFEEPNGTGAYRCTNINMWDMRIDEYYQPPVAMDNTVSSMLIADDPECTAPSDHRIQVVEPLAIVPSNPVVNEPVTATFKLQNIGTEPIMLRIGAAGRYACEQWECTNYADFPWEEDVTVRPGEIYEYERSWAFPQQGAYFSQIVYQLGAEDWPRLGSRVYTTVEPGIQLVKDLFLNVHDPVTREPVTAKYVLKNASSKPLTIRTSAVGKGPNCSNWNCTNYADFPWTERFTLQPGELYNYDRTRDFIQAGDGYFSQILYQFGANDWNHLGTEVDFSVENGVEIQEGLTLSPTMPIAYQPVTARYVLKNVSSKPITIRTSAAGKINCDTWDCTNYADFPWTDRVTILPSGIYTYEQITAFPRDGQYFHQIAYQFGTNDWPKLGDRIYTTIESGIEMVEDLQFSPSQPIENQPITATFKLINTSSRNLVIRTSAAAQGPNCSGWESCQNYADFPWTDYFTLEAGEMFEYQAARTFTEGLDYYGQIIYQFGASDWNHIGTKIDFEVYDDPNPVYKSPLLTSVVNIARAEETIDPIEEAAIPTDIEVSEVTTTSIALRWQISNSPDGFVIYRSDNGNNFSRLWSGEDTNYTDAAVACSTTYYYRISSVKLEKESELSELIKVHTDECSTQPTQVQTFLPFIRQ